MKIYRDKLMDVMADLDGATPSDALDAITPAEMEEMAEELGVSMVQVQVNLAAVVEEFESAEIPVSEIVFPGSDIKSRVEALGYIYDHVSGQALPWRVREGGTYKQRCYASLEELEDFVSFVESARRT